MSANTLRGGGIDVDEALGAIRVALAAGFLWYCIENTVLTPNRPAPSRPDYRLTEAEVRQLDLGREVTLYRWNGAPHLELTAEPLDDQEEPDDE